MELVPADDERAVHISIRGIVQGVGFRPFVYRAAQANNVRGWVQNDGAGVEIHAEGTAAQLKEFLAEVESRPPAEAHIVNFAVAPATAAGWPDFQIRRSDDQAQPITRISPDLAVCPDCLRELFDPNDRRYRYPYLNCTHCGPRYSIIERLPYDRANTTMQAWPLCPACRAEYEDPIDRRFHAQPVACAECGPQYRLHCAGQPDVRGNDAIERAAQLLRAGEILAVKGIGGYHLACDARNPAAVAALRTRKFRKEKPFAVMVRDVEMARQLTELSPAHERLLLANARPIVLVPAKERLIGIAPEQNTLGLMLPYTPLQALLFAAGAPCPLVLTSANRSQEPIAYRDEDALVQLEGIADAFLIGERPIARRVEDSVVTVRAEQPFVIRRARGYAPGAVGEIFCQWPILAVGGDLKNAVTLVVQGQAFVSQYLGDLSDAETATAFRETIRDWLAMYELAEDELVVAHDAHPQYYSTRIAQSLSAARHIAVQHHRAHIASVLSEHNLPQENVIGVAFDGTGYGDDGTIWGGEIFQGSLSTSLDRVAHLRPVQLPGGDAAAQFPVQAAAGFLAEQADLPDMQAAPFHFPERFAAATELVRRKVRCFTSTSLGRLFDAVAAILGFTRPITYEGQAAIWLENLATQGSCRVEYPYPDFDHRPLLAAIFSARRSGQAPCDIAAQFHATVAGTTAQVVTRLARAGQINTVALSGGVFQNELLFKLLSTALADANLRVLTNQSVPVNDGGISLGQAAWAAHRA